jgi:YHS domain-containing protein/thiol-disulfide isomerase/thioredoxin
MTVEFVILCAAVVSQAAPAPQAANAGLTWQADLATARRLARENNRLVLMHFGGTWCEPCRRLEQQVFSQPGFGRDLALRYEAVKVDPHQQPELAEKYGVRAVPTEVVTTARGQLVMKIESPTTVAGYSETMNRIADSVQPLAGALATNDAAPAGPRAVEQTEQNTVDRYADYYGRRQRATPPAANAVPAHAGQPASSQTALSSPPARSAGRSPSSKVDESRVPASNQGLATTAGQPTPSADPSRDMAQAEPQNPPFGLDKYCPVTLVDKRRWEPGNEKFGAIHRGRTYLFVSAEAQQAFLASPDRYSPVFAGNDPVLRVENGQEVPGKREHGAFYNNRIYLFTSEDTFQRFDRDPTRYTAEVPRQSLRR